MGEQRGRGDSTMSYLERYSLTTYSPRARAKDIPFWYREDKARRVWGLLLVVTVIVYAISSFWLLYSASENVLIPALPFVCLLAAYIMWVGYKLAKHG